MKANLIFCFLSLWLSWLFAQTAQAVETSYYEYRDGQRYFCTRHNAPQVPVIPLETTPSAAPVLSSVCIPRCLQRSSITGNCSTYGADVCGQAPFCFLNCIQRSSITGECVEYGADACTND